MRVWWQPMRSADEDVAAAVQAATAFPGLKNMDLASSVSTQSAYQWTQPSWEGLTKGARKTMSLSTWSLLTSA